MGRFAAAAAGSGSWSLHLQRHSFSRSYGAIMPSSLTMVPPIASVCSTRPPVSVWYGRLGPCLGVFPGSVGSAASPCGFVSRLGLVRRADLPALRPTCFHGGVQNPACVPFSVAPSVIAVPRRYRNVRLLRIGYAFRPRLSSRLTLGGLALPRKPWAYGGGVSRAALVTHASILTPLRSTVGRPPASPRRGSSPTNVLYIPPLRRIA